MEGINLNKLENQERDRVLRRLIEEIDGVLLKDPEIQKDQYVCEILIQLVELVEEKLSIREDMAQEYSEDVINDVIKKNQEKIIELSKILEEKYPNIDNYIQIKNNLFKREN